MSRSRAARNTLSRERVVVAAVRLANAHGLGSLTIRSLASDLGVKPMSLYHHVANKEALLDALVEHVFAEIALPDPQGEWRRELAARTRSAREVLVSHPWVVTLLESRTSVARPATLRHHDKVIATLSAAGCSAALAMRSYVLLDSYLYGFVLQEVSMPSAEAVAAAAELSETLQAPAHPHLYSVLQERVLRTDYRFEDEFEPGLEIVLDGINRWIHAERSAHTLKRNEEPGP